MSDMPMNAEVYAAALAFVRAHRETYNLSMRQDASGSELVNAMLREDAAADALDELVGQRVFDAGYVTPHGRLPKVRTP